MPAPLSNFGRGSYARKTARRRSVGERAERKIAERRSRVGHGSRAHTEA